LFEARVFAAISAKRWGDREMAQDRANGSKQGKVI
jgi:hypothetical protein